MSHDLGKNSSIYLFAHLASPVHVGCIHPGQGTLCPLSYWSRPLRTLRPGCAKSLRLFRLGRRIFLLLIRGFCGGCLNFDEVDVERRSSYANIQYSVTGHPIWNHTVGDRLQENYSYSSSVILTSRKCDWLSTRDIEVSFASLMNPCKANGTNVALVHLLYDVG